MNLNFTINSTSPKVYEYNELRFKVGWGDIDLTMAQSSLNNSLFHATARVDSKLIGMGRVIGDGTMFFYIQDLVVDPDYQNKGVGDGLMQKIEQYLTITAKKGSTVALLSAKGKETFYSRYGYFERCGDPLGKGMCKFI